MTDGNEPDESALKQATSQLNAGLKSCRAVMDDYSALLASERSARDGATQNEQAPEQPSPGD